ncbi:primase-helicase zinc-binding domain-containing protein, partial [Neisseria polysaccharea]
MKPTYQDIKAAARYRWQEIHAAIGIDPKFLRNKHQPCPACGGEDRFRYD